MESDYCEEPTSTESGTMVGRCRGCHSARTGSLRSFLALAVLVLHLAPVDIASGLE